MLARSKPSRKLLQVKSLMLRRVIATPVAQPLMFKRVTDIHGTYKINVEQ